MEMEINAHSALKNSYYNFIGYLWPIVFAIFITPVIVLKLGARDYGIFIFINTVLSMMNLLDLGIGTATLKHIAEYYSTKQEKNLQNLIRSMNTVFLIIGMIGLSVFIIISLFLPYFLPNQSIESNYQLIFIIAGLTFLISSASNIFNIIPNALQRFDVSTKIGLVISTLTALSNLALVLLGYQLTAILLSQLFFSLISLTAMSYHSKKLLPQAGWIYGWTKDEIKKSYRFGLATFISGIAGSTLTYLDRLIIPLFLGPTQLTYYSLPGNITSRIPGVTSSLSGAIFPATVSLNSTNDKEKIKRLYIRSFRLLMVISWSICFSIIFLADKILHYWLSIDFANQATNVLIILALTNLLLALSYLLNNFLLALGKFHFLTIIYLIMAGLNAIFLFFLLPKYGINGGAWAYLLSVTPIIYILYRVEIKYLELSQRANFYFSHFFKLGLTTGLFFLIVHYGIYPLVTNLASLIILGPVSVLIFLGLYLILGFYETEDINDIRLFSQKILSKLNKKTNDESF